MRQPTLLLLPLSLALFACTEQEALVTAPQVSIAERIGSSFRTLEVAEVSLPSYAAATEIAELGTEGLTLTDALWADDPTRAVTLALTRNLKELTGVRVASEPWPFEERAAARIDVRVEELLVSDATLRLAGQYFVADLEGEGRDHAHLFDLSVPLASTAASAHAAARAALIADLARDIARRAL